MIRLLRTALCASVFLVATSAAPTQAMAVNGSETYAPLADRAVSGYRNAAYYVNWYEPSLLNTVMY